MKMTSEEVKKYILRMINEEQLINSKRVVLAYAERILGNIEMANRLGILNDNEAKELIFTSVKTCTAQIGKLNTEGHSVLN